MFSADVLRFRFNRRANNTHKILAGIHRGPHTKREEITRQLPSLILSKNCANKLTAKLTL